MFLDHYVAASHTSMCCRFGQAAKKLATSGSIMPFARSSTIPENEMVIFSNHAYDPAPTQDPAPPTSLATHTQKTFPIDSLHVATSKRRKAVLHPTFSEALDKLTPNESNGDNLIIVQSQKGGSPSGIPLTKHPPALPHTQPSVSKAVSDLQALLAQFGHANVQDGYAGIGKGVESPLKLALMGQGSMGLPSAPLWVEPHEAEQQHKQVCRHACACIHLHKPMQACKLVNVYTRHVLLHQCPQACTNIHTQARKEERQVFLTCMQAYMPVLSH